MIHFYDSSSLAVSRWRNGGGETREIISFPPAADPFSWRISIATLAADGAFSLFPGVDRVITLLEGEGVELAANGKPAHRLIRNQPFAFSGEQQIDCRLTGGVSKDFNVMTRRETHRAEVRVISDGFSPRAEEAGVVYVLAGEWITGELRLRQGQGVWWEKNAEPLAPASSDALLLLAEIAEQ